MNKKLYFFLVIGISASIILFSFSVIPPTSMTGANGPTCQACHSSFGLNSGGGSVTINGLPAQYTPGQAYPFSITITHGAADRKRWGFSIEARDADGNNIGTFTSTNPNAALNVNGSELSHLNAVTTSVSSSFTYNNLKWTAPSQAPTSGDKSVTFYVAANAANGNGNTIGDYIYSNSVNIPMPIKLISFDGIVNNKNEVELNWVAEKDLNSKEFVVERSEDLQYYYSIGVVALSSGNKYSFIDKKNTWKNRPIGYRLKMVDKDGSVLYSNVITIRLKNDNIGVVNAWPTILEPGKTLNVNVDAKQSEKAKIILVDLTGKKVDNWSYDVQQGNNHLMLKLPTTLSSGRYFVQYCGEKMIQTISVIVKK